MNHPRSRAATLWPVMAAVAVAVVLPLVLACPAADAAWTGQGAGSAAGAATVMPTGSAPSGVVSGDQVTVSWPAAEFPNGADVAGYVVHRYNSATGAPATVNAGCSGVITTTSCTETGVAPGTWIYTDTPMQSNWTGTASAASAPVTVASS
jgi:hypothetical protein